MESKNRVQKDPPQGTPKVRLEQEQYAGQGHSTYQFVKERCLHSSLCSLPCQGEQHPRVSSHPRIVTVTDRANFKVSHILSTRTLSVLITQEFYMTRNKNLPCTCVKHFPPNSVTVQESWFIFTQEQFIQLLHLKDLKGIHCMVAFHKKTALIKMTYLMAALKVAAKQLLSYITLIKVLLLSIQYHF